MKSNHLLKEAGDIASFMYDVANEIESDDSLDEKWRTASRLKDVALILLSFSPSFIVL